MITQEGNLVAEARPQDPVQKKGGEEPVANPKLPHVPGILRRKAKLRLGHRNALHAALSKRVGRRLQTHSERSSP